MRRRRSITRLGSAVAEVVVEMRDRRRHVRVHPEHSDAERHDGEQEPADERQEQDEQAPFVPLHHRFAAAERFQRGEVRIILQDEVGLRIAQRRDNAGHDEQQRPEQGEDHDEEIQDEGAHEVVEAIEQHRDLRAPSARYLEIEAVDADGRCPAAQMEDDRPDHGCPFQRCADQVQHEHDERRTAPLPL